MKKDETKRIYVLFLVYKYSLFLLPTMAQFTSIAFPISNYENLRVLSTLGYDYI